MTDKQDQTTSLQVNESTISETFKPTPHMEKWLAVTMESGSDSPTEIASLSGIDKSTYYKWQDVPGFIEWFEGEWNRKLLGNGWKLDVVGMKNAKRDYKYWEGMQRRMGRLQDKESGPVVNIGAKSDEMSIIIT